MTLQQIFVFVAAVFMVMAALAMGAPNLHFMAAATVAIPVVAYAASRLGLRGLRCTRRAADHVFEGRDFTVSLQLHNEGRLPKFFLHVSDVLPQWMEADAFPSFAVPAVWPGQPVALSYQARAGKRGVYKLGPAGVRSSDPVGLFETERQMTDAAQVVVYPTALPIAGTPGGGGHAFGLVDTERPAAAGRGFEFASIRDYQPGDEQRRIHWKSTARRGRLAVVEYEQSFARDVIVCLDARAGTEIGEGNRTTLEYGVKAAASLADFAVRQGACATLAFSSGGGWHEVEARRADELFAIFEALARVRADGAEPVGEALRRLESRVSAGAVVVAATSDLDGGLLELTARWAGRHIRLCVLLFDRSAFAQGHSAGEVMAFASALSHAGANVEIIGPSDDLAWALGRTCHAAV